MRRIPRAAYRRLRAAWRRRFGAPPVAAPKPVGHPPTTDIEPTHLGPVMDARVRTAMLRMRVGVDPDYDLVQENFDVVHYLLQSPFVAEHPEVDPVRHFMRHGVALRKSPHPDFSMATYLENHPGAESTAEPNPYIDWLKRGRAAGEIADPAAGAADLAPVLGKTPQEVVELLVARRRDLLTRLRTGALGEMFAKAVEIEPLIGETWSQMVTPRLLPFSHRRVTSQVAAIHAAQEAAGFRRARLVIVVNQPRWGGGRRLEGHLAHALAKRIAPDDIVVVYTEAGGRAPADRFPAGVREVDFAAISATLEREEAGSALVALLRSFRADAIFNVNSRLFYDALRSYGQALAASERLFLCFFCSDQSALGVWYGWSHRYFYRTFDYVAGVVTDSDYLTNRLVTTYRVGAEERSRLHVLRAPVDARLPVFPEAPTGPDRRPQVFWAGRWDRQKRIELFLEIARGMPDVDFRMWGEAVLGIHDAELPANVSAQGRYDHIRHIPLSEADVWLYTSAWDGVPSLLLEVAMTGIPIVGTLVGGTSEVLGEDDAWPVAEDLGADAYVRAIRAVLADRPAARARALALRERMLRERTEQDFADKAIDLLLLGELTGGLSR